MKAIKENNRMIQNKSFSMQQVRLKIIRVEQVKYHRRNL